MEEAKSTNTIAEYKQVFDKITFASRWKYCPECGVKLEEAWAYCPQCGTKVGSSGQELQSPPLWPTYPIYPAPYYPQPYYPLYPCPVWITPTTAPYPATWPTITC